MVLTEEKLKALYKTENFKELNIEKGTILTPSARQFLTEKGINLISGKKTDKIRKSHCLISRQRVPNDLRTWVGSFSLRLNELTEPA